MAGQTETKFTSQVWKGVPLAYSTPDLFCSALRKNPQNYPEIITQLMPKSPKWFTRGHTGAFYISYHQTENSSVQLSHYPFHVMFQVDRPKEKKTNKQ